MKELQKVLPDDGKPYHIIDSRLMNFIGFVKPQQNYEGFCLMMQNHTISPIQG
jgi:hypothetical protein